jgi:hypothetical protein
MKRASPDLRRRFPEPAPRFRTSPPLDAATPPLPVLGPRIAALADGETSSYAARLGPLRVATLTYTVRRMLDGGRPLLVVDGVTRMEGVASVLAHAGGTLRTVIEPSTFLPRTSMWTTAADPPKSRAISFDPSQGRAVAAAWTRDWIGDDDGRAASRLLDPLTGVRVLRVLAPPPDGEHRALVVEGTNVHLLTYRRSAPPNRPTRRPPSVGPSAATRWTPRPADSAEPRRKR